MTTPRPLAHLHEITRRYPGLGRSVEEFRSSRGVDLPEWPAWCFLPMAGWYAIVSAHNRVDVLPLNLVKEVPLLAALGTWRYSQGIYRIDPHLLTALTGSIVSGRIPSEVLHRLPEWCLYVETPGQSWIGNSLAGFWMHLEWDANTERTELRFLFDVEGALVPWMLHIGPWTVTEAVDRAMGEVRRQAASVGLTLPNNPEAVEALSAEINPIVSIALYFCSEEPEIDSEREPGTSPQRPQPKRTKKGLRLFPPDKPRIWHMGAEIGKQLRQATAEEATGRSVRTHIRRGHWHGYWTGPRDGERKFIYRWLSPLVVSGTEPSARQASDSAESD